MRPGQIPASDAPYNDIALYPVAERIGLPKSTFALPKPVVVTTSLFGVEIPYRLFPNCIGSREQPQCVFYVAHNTRAQRNEFAVGPLKLDFFAENAGLFATAAGNFFGLTGFNSDYQISSAATIHQSMNGDIVGAAASLGNAWISALQDPGWWVQVLGAVVATGSPRPLAATSAARINNPAKFPAVARALRTQSNLQGLKVTRSVQLIEQPTVFRHTITADVEPVSFARIESEGSLRFSTASRAHYGEGVYAWEAGKTGVGRYIDIEVPPGCAAELIQTPAGTWYRILPAEGTVLPVRIVGHNFTPAEVSMGRALLKGQ